jgi:hypothetical protein
VSRPDARPGAGFDNKSQVQESFSKPTKAMEAATRYIGSIALHCAASLHKNSRIPGATAHWTNAFNRRSPEESREATTAQSRTTGIASLRHLENRVGARSRVVRIVAGSGRNLQMCGKERRRPLSEFPV